MLNTSRRKFLKTAGQGALAAGIGFNIPEGAWLYADTDENVASASAGKETRMECDVLVIGGGFAGCVTAIKAREHGANVILLDKGFVGKSGQSPLANMYYIFNPEWGHKLDLVMNYVSKEGEYLSNRYWMERMALDSYARYQDLVSWGVEFSKDRNGNLRRSPITKEATTEEISYAHSARGKGASTENHMQVMRRKALSVGVKILDRVMVPELLKQNGRIVGAIGIPLDSFEQYTFIAKTTILCVGPCGFKPLGYPMLVSLTGDGEGMAYRAGAELVGKEFIDVHFTLSDAPSVIGRRGISEELDTFLGMQRRQGGGGYPRENADGTPFPARPAGVTDYNFSYLENAYEVDAGHGPIIWNSSNRQRYYTDGATSGMCIRNADGIWPANHDCGSSIPGLYAAGTALGTMQNGAVYYLLGASTCGCAVTGNIAATAAVKEAVKIGKITVDEKEISRAKQFVAAPRMRKGGISPRWLTQLLQNLTMPYFVSEIKRADRLQAAITMIEFMQERLVPMLIARDPHELRLAHETRSMVLVAEMRLKSALFRTESRGNHYREDYPRRDDTNWLAWTKIVQDQGKMKLVKVPMPKEYWPDPSIPYKQRYPYRFPGEEKL